MTALPFGWRRQILFAPFVGTDHDAAVGNVCDQRHWKTSVKRQGTFLPEHAPLRDGEIHDFTPVEVDTAWT